MRWTFWCTLDQADGLAEGLCALNFFQFSRSSLPLKTQVVKRLTGGGEFLELYSGSISPELPHAVVKLLRSLEVGLASVTCDETDGQDDWQQYFTPQHIPGVCDVVPPWAWSPLARFSTQTGGVSVGAEVLVIEPAMAFGTGSHATTQLGLQALSWLHHQDPPGMWTCLLDAGTGSGITSLYARKLGVPFIVACDLDEQVFSNLKKNCALNHVRTPTQVVADVTCVYGTFDWVFVNISLEIILTQIEHLSGWVKSGGYLFLSGFLSENQADVERALEKNSEAFRSVWTQVTDEWVGMLLKKK